MRDSPLTQEPATRSRRPTLRRTGRQVTHRSAGPRRASARPSASSRARASLIGVVTVVSLAAGCSSDGTGSAVRPTPEPTTSTADAARPVSGAAITIAIRSEPTSLDPHLVDDGSERAIDDNVYETLLARDADGRLVPHLATGLPRRLSSTTWEFDLRDDVTFHDGTPFRADAVVASVERMVQLIAEGHSTREIADRLTISTKTVETHRAQIMDRLNIRDVAGLTRFALRAGLIDPER